MKTIEKDVEGKGFNLLCLFEGGGGGLFEIEDLLELTTRVHENAILQKDSLTLT